MCSAGVLVLCGRSRNNARLRPVRAAGVVEAKARLLPAKGSSVLTTEKDHTSFDPSPEVITTRLSDSSGTPLVGRQLSRRERPMDTGDTTADLDLLLGPL